METGTAWRAPTRRGACYFILPAISRVILLVFLLVSAAIDEENYFTFRWLWQWSSIGQGRRAGLSHLSSGVVSVAQFNPWQAHVIVVDACASRTGDVTGRI